MRVRFRYHQRVPRLLLVVFILALGAPAAGAPPATVEIVLDASAGMHRPGVGGSPDSRHGSRGAGCSRRRSSSRPAEPRDRSPSCRWRPIGRSHRIVLDDEPQSFRRPGWIRMRWIRVLDDLRPRGFRPLISSVLAALDDLDPTTRNRRIVVVTSGDDQCGSGPQQVAAALAAADHPAELRMVGLGLDQTVLDRFGGIPIRNATSAEELIDALRWAILDLADHPRPTGHLALQLSWATPKLLSRVWRSSIRPPMRPTPHPSWERPASISRPDGTGWWSKRRPGGQIEFRNLLVSAETEGSAVLDLGQPPPVAVGIAGDPVFSRTRTWIDVAGSPPPRCGTTVHR